MCAFDLTIKKLSWQFAFDVVTWKVWPIDAVSPLHDFLVSGSGNMGIQFRMSSSPLALVQFHTSIGFQGVPEHTMRRLHSILSAPTLSSTEPSCSVDACMTLGIAAMVHLKQNCGFGGVYVRQVRPHEPG